MVSEKKKIIKIFYLESIKTGLTSGGDPILDSATEESNPLTIFSIFFKSLAGDDLLLPTGDEGWLLFGVPVGEMRGGDVLGLTASKALIALLVDFGLLLPAKL